MCALGFGGFETYGQSFLVVLKWGERETGKFGGNECVLPCVEYEHVRGVVVHNSRERRVWSCLVQAVLKYGSVRYLECVLVDAGVGMIHHPAPTSVHKGRARLCAIIQAGEKKRKGKEENQTRFRVTTPSGMHLCAYRWLPEREHLDSVGPGDGSRQHPPSSLHPRNPV